MIFIGIDPGLTGAISFVEHGVSYKVFDIPVMMKGTGSGKVKNQVDATAFTQIIKSNICPGEGAVIIERVQAMTQQGVASVFSLGDTFGTLRGVCAALGLHTKIVTPQSWKKHYRLGKEKEDARAEAIRLFPEAPLARKKDHNRAEALLIANYGRYL